MEKGRKDYTKPSQKIARAWLLMDQVTRINMAMTNQIYREMFFAGVDALEDNLIKDQDVEYIDYKKALDGQYDISIAKVTRGGRVFNPESTNKIKYQYYRMKFAALISLMHRTGLFPSKIDEIDEEDIE